MRTVLRPRHSLHSITSLQTRTLRNTPREVPTYVKRWDPTRHRPSPPVALPVEQGTELLALRNLLRTKEREKLRDAQTVEIKRVGLDYRHRKTVSALNYQLSLAQKGIGLRAVLWKTYTIARYAVPDLTLRMPDRAWDILWSTQAVTSVTNRDRSAHLHMLNVDMAAAGVMTSIGQRVAYIEELFHEGHEQQALLEWEIGHSHDTSNTRQDYKPEHLELGAKLYGLAGVPERARDVMNELYSLYPDHSPNVMMVVFRAHTSSNRNSDHAIANELYEDMKQRLKDGVSIEHYDSWLIGFLEAQHVGYAMQVFQDMLEGGMLSATGSAEAVEEVLKRLKMLYRLGKDIAKMSSVVLEVFTTLPISYHDHVFGEWLKTAVVAKAPEAAAEIITIMIERGHIPETLHFNLLLSALFRSQERPNVLRAENIGWKMIDEPRRVEMRKKRGQISTAVAIFEKGQNVIAKDIYRAEQVPPADTTTFALIMDHHTRLQQWEHVDYLIRHLREADLEPNAAIMNVILDQRCRQGKYNEAWAIYNSLTEPTEDSAIVSPNGASIRSLWKVLRLALGDPNTASGSNLPQPRKLLADTIRWWKSNRSRDDAERLKQGLTTSEPCAILHLMLHCFTYTNDIIGSLIALHAMRSIFEIRPEIKTTEIIQRQLAWVDLQHSSDPMRADQRGDQGRNQDQEQVKQLYDLLAGQRVARLGPLEDGKLSNSFTNEEIRDMELDLLSEFIRVILKRSHCPAVVEQMINKAKFDVGLPDLSTGDMSAYEVV